MFISPNNNDHVNQVSRADLSGADRTQQPVMDHRQRRYQYLFQSSPLQSNKSLYQHVVNLVNQFLNQIMGRNLHSENQQQDSGATKRVRGIADRSPRLVDPDNPSPSRDSIFFGVSKDYPSPVIAVEFDGKVKPVFYEGNQVVARHLDLNHQEECIEGKLILNDGTKMPIEIMILTAV